MAIYKTHSRVTSYGILGALAAVFCAVSLILVNTKEQECTRSSYQQLQAYNSIGVVVGVVLCVAALFQFAEFLHTDMRALFHLVSLLVLLVGGLFGYAAAYTYWRPCIPIAGLIPKDASIGLEENRNVFTAQDGQMIAVFFLQILAALCFVVCGFDFYGHNTRVAVVR